MRTTTTYFCSVVLLCAAVVSAAIAIVLLDHTVNDLKARIVKLEHACIPMNTGGGVWQCMQPNVKQAPPK